MNFLYMTCHHAYLEISCMDSHIIFSALGIFVINIEKSYSQKKLVMIYDSNNQPFLKGWRETFGARLWRISLRPDLRPDLAKFTHSNEDTKADSREK